MVKQEIIVENETGLHARPAAQFVQLASKYQSEITVLKAEKQERINAKSIISVIAGGISKGTRIVIVADGADEKEAVSALVKLVQSKFGEV